MQFAGPYCGAVASYGSTIPDSSAIAAVSLYPKPGVHRGPPAFSQRVQQLIRFAGDDAPLNGHNEPIVYNSEDLPEGRQAAIEFPRSTH